MEKFTLSEAKSLASQHAAVAIARSFAVFAAQD